MAIKTLTKPKLGTDTNRKMDNGRPYQVIIWNDDHNTMDHVLRCLVRICNQPPQAAVEIMMTAHTQGKAVAKTCAFELAEAIREQLEFNGLTATIEET